MYVVPATRQMSIKFDQIDQAAMIGIRRAAVFLGLGVNAANDPFLKNYRLTHETSVEILPNPISPEMPHSPYTVSWTPMGFHMYLCKSFTQWSRLSSYE